MSFSTSQISLISHVEGLAVRLSQGSYSSKFKHLKGCAFLIETQIFSRAVALLISPAALLDFGFHTIAFPIAIIYAIGKSIVIRKLDFSLPREHLQRVREAIFPILFGSIFGVIHPYLGAYAAEPTKKHIGYGFLLSQTKENRFDVVCSPVTAISEAKEIGSKLSKEERLSSEEKKYFDQIKFWEGEFEKIQSIEFLHLKITQKVGKAIFKKIDESQLHIVAKELLKRIAIVVYPVLAFADLSILLFTNLVCLGSGITRLIGGQSPAYLEKTWSLELQIYNIVKIPIFLTGAIIGFFVSFASPEKGFSASRYSLEWMAMILFKIKMVGIKFKVWTLGDGKSMILPAVDLLTLRNPNKEFNLLPTTSSHMRYIVITRMGDSYEAELCERGHDHKKTEMIDRKDLNMMLDGVLAMRFGFSKADKTTQTTYFTQAGSAALGLQTGVNNCVVASLMSALQVVRARGGDGFDTFCSEFRQKAFERYHFYRRDFYPFGNAEEIFQEVSNLEDAVI